MIILVDGFISTVAYLIAFKRILLELEMPFCHQSAEKGIKKLLNILSVASSYN
jgi:nicotinate-nucleotide--dimethylbenzimidazole phosphoribosyltransferase